MDDDGLDLDALAAALDAGPKPAFLYTIPTFQNPSGRTLSVERRQRLVELARERDLLVLEDDPYGLVRYEGDPPPTLFELDGGERVVLLLVLLEDDCARCARRLLRPAAGTRRRAGDACRVDLHHACPARPGDGLRVPPPRQPRDERGGCVRSAAARRDAMLEALEQELPNATWSRPQGGYFVWWSCRESSRRRPAWPSSRAPTSAAHRTSSASRSATCRRRRFARACGASAQRSRHEAGLARRHQRAPAMQPERRARRIAR